VIHKTQRQELAGGNFYIPTLATMRPSRRWGTRLLGSLHCAVEMMCILGEGEIDQATAKGNG